MSIAGGLSAAVKRAKENLGRLHKIEVQVASEPELQEALENGADILLFENLPPEEFSSLVAVARKLSPSVTIQCSGGVTLENVRFYAEAGADMIVISSLTNAAPAVEIAFQIQPF